MSMLEVLDRASPCNVACHPILARVFAEFPAPARGTKRLETV